MIELKTDCESCIHKKVCKNKNNAKNAMQRLKNATYGNGPNDDYDWETMMKHENVEIEFSCPDFKSNNSVLLRKGC